MEDINETPKKRKYPERNRAKVAYYEDFEMSMEYEKKSSKLKKSSDSSEEGEKENDATNELIDDNEEISEYEKVRLKNMEENRRLMIELGLIDPKAQLMNNVAGRPKPKTLKPKSKKVQPTKKPSQPIKRSLRLMNKTPDGKAIPIDIFQDTPVESPNLKEEKTRLEEEVLPMGEDGENIDFLDSLKTTLSQDSGTSSLESCNSIIEDMRDLQFKEIERITSSRVLSMCIHPMENKLLVIAGSVHGELGLWNVNDGSVAEFKPHMRSTNCVSVSKTDHSKIFTTSFEGTVRRGDINKSVFDLIYQTDEKTNMCHVTWHAQIDDNSLIIAHGTGEAGVIDIRTKSPQRWFHCHPRSIRTIHLHPTQPHYFLSASGIGECKIFDLRGTKKHVDECVGDLSHLKGEKGLTSAFFSPDGNKVVATCNDDYIRIYDTSDLSNPKDLHKIMHDNHTGRWLSVFKAIWHPQSSDLVFVGSMLHPRRIQMYNGSGRLVRELKDDQLTTVTPVIALHPTLPVVVGGNSTGKGHLFTTSQIISEYLG